MIGYVAAVSAFAPEVFETELESCDGFKHAVDGYILTVAIRIRAERLLIVEAALTVGGRHKEFAREIILHTCEISQCTGSYQLACFVDRGDKIVIHAAEIVEILGNALTIHALIEYSRVRDTSDVSAQFHAPACGCAIVGCEDIAIRQISEQGGQSHTAVTAIPPILDVSRDVRDALGNLMRIIGESI